MKIQPFTGHPMYKTSPFSSLSFFCSLSFFIASAAFTETPPTIDSRLLIAHGGGHGGGHGGHGGHHGHHHHHWHHRHGANHGHWWHHHHHPAWEHNHFHHWNTWHHPLHDWYWYGTGAAALGGAAALYDNGTPGYLYDPNFYYDIDADPSIEYEYDEETPKANQIQEKISPNDPRYLDDAEFEESDSEEEEPSDNNAK